VAMQLSLFPTERAVYREFVDSSKSISNNIRKYTNQDMRKMQNKIAEYATMQVKFLITNVGKIIRPSWFYPTWKTIETGLKNTDNCTWPNNEEIERFEIFVGQNKKQIKQNNNAEIVESIESNIKTIKILKDLFYRLERLDEEKFEEKIDELKNSSETSIEKSTYYYLKLMVLEKTN
jgi:hypothetical protein